jgi:hypothetical protein
VGICALKKTDEVFAEETLLPDIPHISGDTHRERTAEILLEHIFELNFKMPSPEAMAGFAIRKDCISDVATLLKCWVDTFISELSSRHVLDGGSIPPNDILKLIRAFAFLAASEIHDQFEIQELYWKMINTLSANTLYRYMKLVIVPLVNSIHQERGTFIPRIRSLTKNLITLVNLFNRYWIAAAVEALEVSSVCLFIRV